MTEFISVTAIYIGIMVYLTNTNIIFQVLFEGIVGSGFRGDIALDDVSISGGQCQGNYHGVKQTIFMLCVGFAPRGIWSLCYSFHFDVNET